MRWVAFVLLLALAALSIVSVANAYPCTQFPLKYGLECRGPMTESTGAASPDPMSSLWGELVWGEDDWG